MNECEVVVYCLALTALTRRYQELSLEERPTFDPATGYCPEAAAAAAEHGDSVAGAGGAVAWGFKSPHAIFYLSFYQVTVQAACIIQTVFLLSLRPHY